MALTEKGQALLDYLIANPEDATVHDVAAGMGLGWQSVNGTMNSLVKKGLAEREEATVEVVDGEKTSTKTVKFLRATEAGRNYTGEDAE